MSDFDLYSWNTPNGQKIVIALEEAGADYCYKPVDITKGEQHTPKFRALSPDGKIPVLVDNKNKLYHFESGAILLYLAACYPELDGQSPAEQAAVRSWTFWQVGQLGPLTGQYGRFQTIEPSNPQAIEHFTGLIWRCLEVMEQRLAVSEFLAGKHFTVADITCIPWIASKQSYLQKYELNWSHQYPSLRRWAEQLQQRASVAKAFNL